MPSLLTSGSLSSPRLAFRGQFRRYQKAVLDLIESDGQPDRQLHIVAPPGSGKTLVGLELIGRYDRPAVVFAPTSTIQAQWLDKLSMFTERPVEVGGADPVELRPVNVFTYQLISVPSQADDELGRVATAAWADEFGSARNVSLAEASQRIEQMRTANPDAHRRELAGRVRRVRRELLRADPATVYRYLHPNAQALVDRLHDAGVGTVVLDECHHLLDYWALVLRALIGRLEQPVVIGLTATLPSPEDDNEYENYSALLGHVDFEVPTPAVIKEGDLAPFRDLAVWVTPTEREADWLLSAEQHLADALTEITDSADFLAWTTTHLRDPVTAVAPAASMSWIAWAAANDELAEGLVAMAAQHELALPPGAEEYPGDPHAPVSLKARLSVVERYALDVLKLSSDPVSHDLLRRLRQAIAPFGYSLTERGLRQGRSVVDLMLSSSAAKARATADIVAREHEALGSRLRAVVVTDFERMVSGAERAAGILENDAGSAFRVFRTMAEDERLAELHPVLVTGSVVRTTAAFGTDLARALEGAARAQGIEMLVRSSSQDGIAEMVADGSAWRPGLYVALVTGLFEAGVSRLLVGTRGLLGEGWDAPTANTLINLTNVTTATSIAQLRGRVLRLDPAWPEKVAHVYDVICVAPGLEAGGVEWSRLERRHEHTFGIVPPRDRREGQVVRGLEHVDPWMLREIRRNLEHAALAYGVTASLVKPRPPWAMFDRAAANGRSFRAAGERPATRAAWRVGEPYDNAIDWFSRLSAIDPGFRTAAVVRETLGALLLRIASAVVTAVAVTTAFWLSTGQRGDAAMLVPVVAIVTAVLTLAVQWRAVRRAVHLLLVGQPVDAVIGDVARAVLGGLRDAGLVSGRLANDKIAIDWLDGAAYVRLAEPDATKDAELFARSLDEVFDPNGTPRYLIRRDDGRFPGMRWARAVGFARNVALRGRAPQPVYHPVPSALSTKRDHAESFAAQWKRWVGGGTLIYGHSDEGRLVRARARRDRRAAAEHSLVERWS